MKPSFALVVVIALLLLFGAIFVFGLARGTLRQATGRTCFGCVVWHWNGSSWIRANRLSGTYRFAREATWLVSFEGGTVRIAGRELEPGCHEGEARSGDELQFEEAAGLRVTSPRGDQSCDAHAGV